MRLRNLVGETFGRLTVRARASNRGANTYWLCRCECGTELDVAMSSLTSGKTISCGCFMLEVARSQRKIPPTGGRKNYANFVGQAKHRGIVVGITRDDWLELLNQPCYYCGEMRDSRGVDRIDSDQGYLSGNCLPACWICNRAKSVLSHNEFVEMCRLVAARWS